MRTLVIAGCGHWGRNYIRIFSGLVGADAIVAVDSNAAALDAIRRQHRGIETAPTLRDALERATPRMAVVATPAATHFELVKECLKRGMDVLAEKPLTLNAAQAAKLASLSARGRRVLMVGHTFLYNPAVRKVQALVKAGACGELYYMKATRTHLGLIRPDVNAVWDLAPHDVAIFNYLTDSMPTAVSAAGGCFLKKGKEDVAFINLFYPRNVLANIHVSWADSNKERTVEVVGSKARIVFDDLNTLERVKIFEKGISLNVSGGENFGEFLFALRDGDIISPKVETAEPLSEVCREFLHCVESRGQPLAGAQNGVDVVEVMCAVERSLKQGGRRVPVARQARGGKGAPGKSGPSASE